MSQQLNDRFRATPKTKHAAAFPSPRKARAFGAMSAVFAAAMLAALTMAPASADPLTDLGKSLFFDKNMSVNGTQACASCHLPNAGFAAAGERFIPGALGDVGNRIAPSAAYAFASPPFHHIVEEGAPLFLGGLFYDGRATGAVTGQAASDQAGGPILNPHEMALPNEACAVQRACETSGLGALEPAACELMQTLTPCQSEIAEEMAEETSTAFTTIARALAAYEASEEVSPFRSRYDAYLAGETSLSDAEMAGMDLFADKGQCAACHIMDSTEKPALFTDFTYDNLGLPANPGAPLDTGLATTLQGDMIYASFAETARGKFKVPTLRNVAKGEGRHYMHNGYFETLQGVVRFYNTRDVWPACETWMPEAQAIAAKCWPAAEIAETANHDELGNLHLTPVEEEQIVAFLGTLTDLPVGN